MILLAKLLLALPLVAFYVMACAIFINAVKEAHPVVRRCLFYATWAALAAGIFWDLGNLHLHLHRLMVESIIRMATTSIGLCLGFLLSAQIVRHAAKRNAVPR